MIRPPGPTQFWSKAYFRKKPIPNTVMAIPAINSHCWPNCNSAPSVTTASGARAGGGASEGASGGAEDGAFGTATALLAGAEASDETGRICVRVVWTSVATASNWPWRWSSCTATLADWSLTRWRSSCRVCRLKSTVRSVPQPGQTTVSEGIDTWHRGHCIAHTSSFHRAITMPGKEGKVMLQAWGLVHGSSTNGRRHGIFHEACSARLASDPDGTEIEAEDMLCKHS